MYSKAVEIVCSVSSASRASVCSTYCKLIGGLYHIILV